MKKSWLNLAQFVFLTFLTIILPLYVLLSGSATLLPYVKAVAIVLCTAGLVALLATGATVVLATRGDEQARAGVRTLNALTTLKPWRYAYFFGRTVLFAVILLALNCPLHAAFVVTGLIAVVLIRGLLDSYYDAYFKSILKGSEIRRGEARNSEEHDATIGWLGEVNKIRSPYEVRTTQGADGKIYTIGVGEG